MFQTNGTDNKKLNQALLPFSVEKYNRKNNKIHKKLHNKSLQLFIKKSEIHFINLVANGSSDVDTQIAKSKTSGKINQNNATTATIANTIKIIGYIRAQIYLFLISVMNSYSCAKESNTVTKFHDFSHAFTTLQSHSSK